MSAPSLTHCLKAKDWSQAEVTGCEPVQVLRDGKDERSERHRSKCCGTWYVVRRRHDVLLRCADTSETQGAARVYKYKLPLWSWEHTCRKWGKNTTTMDGFARPVLNPNPISAGCQTPKLHKQTFRRFCVPSFPPLLVVVGVDRRKARRELRTAPSPPCNPSAFRLPLASPGVSLFPLFLPCLSAFFPPLPLCVVSEGSLRSQAG